MTVGYTKLRELTPSELALLPDAERNREFGSDSRRQQYYCGHALLRLMLQELTGNAAAEHGLTTEEGGKPIGPDGIAVSITHTGDSVACAVALAGQVGVDIEAIDERREVSQITERFFSSDEKHWLVAGPRARFYMLWVLKEAFVKAHGQSIFGGLEKLRCTVEPPAIKAEASEGGYADLSLYQHRDLMLAVATTEEPLNDVNFVQWPADTSVLQPGSDYSLLATTNSEARSNAA